MKIKQVSFLVDSNLWQQFETFCEKAKVKPEEVLRRYIKYQTTGEM